MFLRYAFLLLTGVFAPLFGQSSLPQRTTGNTAPGDWPMYARDFRGTRYSPLARINPTNVSKLAPAWSYRLPPPPSGPTGVDDGPFGRGGAAGVRETNSEATPIVVNGRMFLPAGDRILALDPETGQEIWQARLERITTARGVAFWPGDRNNPPRILFTAGTTLRALNANTGRADPGFGKEGIVNMTVGWSGVPMVFGNIVLLGATVGEVPKGPPGDSRAYDARTGEKLWEFHSVPHPGEPGFGSWQGESWKEFSGTNVWGWYLTVDEARGLVYFPFGSPAGNYYGGDRPGDNLFGNSIVAVDARTGKYKWHFQTVHHDIWDADLPPAPSLIDITVNGKKIPALAQIGKTAWMFILDRTTGKPVFGVEERPVPKGDVPGEWYSPTQPFPLKPPPLARMTFKKEDMVTAEDTTPEHAKACADLWDKSGGFRNEGPFTPFLYHEDGAPPQSTLQFPGNGGANWGGTAADPRTGYVYVQTHDQGLVGWMEKKRPGGDYGSGNGSPQLYDRGSVNGPGPYFRFAANAMDANGKSLGTLPCQKPPWGRLWAVNANTGEIAWEVPLGLTETLPLGKQQTGNTGSAGPIVTAGGLVFIGATADHRLRAFDSKTGKELWVGSLEHDGNANPITYQGKSGRQYVAVVARSLVQVFALPPASAGAN